MRVFKFLSVAVVFLASVAQARLTDNQMTIKVEGSQVSITPKEKFHLNAEAPATAVFDHLEALFKPSTKTEALFVFKRPPNTKKVELSFYVCDNSKTVCEQHKESVNLASGDVQAAPLSSGYNSLKEFNLSSQNGKPTLLVFSAPWCPACVRMQTEVFHIPRVEKEMKNINFIKLNSDVADNYELSEKFKVKAIPTLILLDSKGQEVYRWLDYQPAAGFAKSLKSEVAKINELEGVAQKAAAGDQKAIHELAVRAFNTLDYAEALKWYSQSQAPEDRNYKLAAEVSSAADNYDGDTKKSADYSDVLEKAITLTTSKLDKIRWTADYLQLKADPKAPSEEIKNKGQELVKEIDALLKNKKSLPKIFKQSTYGEYGDFEAEELLWLKAGVYKTIGLEAEKKQTQQQSIKLVSKKSLSVKEPGKMLMAIGYLREAEDTTLVPKLYEKLIKAYPSTYVYYEKYARYQQKYKNPDKALLLVDQALMYPEGNRPQLSLLKTQILVDLKRNTEALALIDETLSADYSQHKRFERTLKKLAEIKTEISNQKHE